SKLTKLTQNKSRGIGMDIFQDRSGKVRCVPFPNSEAGLAGIRYGDELQVVDNLEAKDSSLTELAQRICGSGKREVELQVQSPKKPPRNLLVPCQKIGKAPSVVMEYQGPRQIIHILRFGPETQKELLAHLKSLKDDQEIFLDLRGNTGGNLKVGLECAKLFLPKGRIILRRVSKSGAKSEINPKEGYWSYSYLHLRQDRYTASAAEMFIAALVSAKRGTSFGETSAGKAYVQDLFTLKDGSILKITTEKMLYPTKEGDWESQGLRPSASRP
ncbi:MAG: hypothetical protein IJU40_08620, partial [Desulfovibrionaceae bacterium]|nr:hypothetical protein [Desulfovibrionaceae bacterium]